MAFSAPPAPQRGAPERPENELFSLVTGEWRNETIASSCLPAYAAPASGKSMLSCYTPRVGRYDSVIHQGW